MFIILLDIWSLIEMNLLNQLYVWKAKDIEVIVMVVYAKLIHSQIQKPAKSISEMGESND